MGKLKSKVMAAFGGFVKKDTTTLKDRGGVKIPGLDYDPPAICVSAPFDGDRRGGQPLPRHRSGGSQVGTWGPAAPQNHF